MTVVGVVLFPLLAFLQRGRRTRATSGRRDAFAVVWGTVMVVLPAIAVAQRAAACLSPP